VTYRILLTDDIDAEGVALLAAEPALAVDQVPTLPRNELLARIGTYDAVVVRSATKISPEVLRAGSRLAVVGRAGVGLDNIDVDLATELGVAVFNAPAGNTIAVAELFFGTVIGLLRQLPQAYASMRDGCWERSRFIGQELQGKVLGIVGLGRIGAEIATRAHAFGMQVMTYDPSITDARCQALRVRRAATLEELLDAVTVLTVHTPLTTETRGLIGAAALSRLARGAIVINLARGGIVDEDALGDALRSGHLGGAVLDVYSTEPLGKEHPLRAAPNVLLTPHIGASTIEAQRNVAVDVCQAVRDALLRGELSRSVNAAGVAGEQWPEVRPAVNLAVQLAAVGRALLETRGARVVDRIDVSAGASLVGARDALIAAAAMGALSAVVAGERLNLINARALAVAREIALAFTEPGEDAFGEEGGPRSHGVSVRLGAGTLEQTVSGVAHPSAVPRLTRINGFDVDVHPRGTLLVLTNRDVPGVIGHVGTALGAAGVNIAEYHQARLAPGGEALAAISVDGVVEGPASVSLQRALAALPDVRSATVVVLPTI
jgi:D-3-phosphoglycerate dehydrogenase